MITCMFQLQPHMRLCMSDIIGHPWMQMDYPTPEEVAAEFGRRHEINKKKASEEEDRKNAMENSANERRARRGADATKIFLDANDVPAELKDNPNVQTRALEAFSMDYNKHINFFSKLDATEVMTQITNYLEASDNKFEVSDKKFKVSYEAQRRIDTP